MNQDRMTLELRPRCIVGCYDWEKELRREMGVRLELLVDCAEAGRTDSMEAALNYEPLVKGAMRFAEEGDFDLVEALAEGLARLCVVEHGVHWVRVSVTKREALPGLDAVTVAIERGSADYLEDLAPGAAAKEG